MPTQPDSAPRQHSSRQRFQHFRREVFPQRLPVDDDTPAQPTGDRKRRRGYLREYLRWLRPFLRSIIFITCIAIATAALSLVLPAATMHIIDHVLPARDMRGLHLLGTGLLVLVCVQQTLDWTRHWTTARLNARIIYRLRQKLYDHLLALPLPDLSNLKTGGITARLSGDIDSITGMLQLGIITPVVAGLKVAMTLAVLLWINWKLAAAATVLVPGVMLLNFTYIRTIRPIYRSMRRDRAEIDGRVVETFGGIRVVRAFGRERTESLEYARRHHTVIRKNLMAQVMEFMVWAGWGFVIPLISLLIIWLGGALVLAGQGSIGGLIAFQMYLMMLLAPVSTVVKSYGDMQQGLAALERVFDLLHTPPDKPDAPGARLAPQRVETIEFDRVSFAYQTGTPVLRDASLLVRGGTTVALVGPSGAGKTTLTNLVARFYDPTHGAIRLNGVDLRDLKLESYRRLLGLVQQDVFLFDGTIAENIAFGRLGATQAEIEDAARQANAHEFIRGLSDGYQTVVGERGVRLSGGQAQRISIARAILADPQILILDEATSNLDSESEQLIQKSLETLLSHRTTFVIAHRLSTVVRADLIVVLVEGRIIETGTHESLMAADSSYRAMVLRQRRAMEAATDVVGADWQLS